MTFSLTARCARTGMFGVVVTSSSPAVAARCAWVRGHVGAVASQNITDPGLGLMGLDLLGQGYGARKAMEIMVAAREYSEARQLAIVDRLGHTAHHSGSGTLGTNNVAQGENAVAAGNLLSTPKVPVAMVEAFEAHADDHLAERLLKGVEAGLDAGGEEGDVKSAGVTVCHEHDWPICDLRVDWHDEPIAALRRVWDVYRPQMDAYIMRALDPRDTPSYGVPGDP
ncbi:MAG: DUF1028 domain-containing protein [Rhodospirillales bacterium]|nr:DUF1028 domain-containing protein [Rhodospirillales bacterium]